MRMADTFEMRMNQDRELLAERALEKSRWGSKAEMTEAAWRTYLELIENVEENRDRVGPDEARRWATKDVKVVVQGRAEY